VKLVWQSCCNNETWKTLTEAKNTTAELYACVLLCEHLVFMALYENANEPTSRDNLTEKKNKKKTHPCLF